MESKRIRIAKEKLYDLYIVKRLNAYQIARKLRCGHSTIYRRLREHGIKSRDNSQAHIKYEKKDFSGDLKEKAYLIGFRLGDLWVKKIFNSELSKIIRIDCHSTKNDQIDLFKSLFSKYSKVLVTQHKGGTTKARCYVNHTFNFLLPKKDKIEEWILKDNKTFFAFLGGYADAEGHFGINSSNNQSRFVIATYDKNILKQIRNKLMKVGISCPPLRIVIKKGSYIRSKGKRIDKRNKDTWSLSAHKKESLFKLISYLDRYILHKKRRSDMQKVRENIGNEW